MGVQESRCPGCGAKVVVVYHDRSLETLYVERTCTCPVTKSPPVFTG